MMLVLLVSSVARAQSIEVAAEDEGAVMSLLEEDTSFVVDLASDAVDLDAVILETPEIETTFGAVVDAARDVTGDVDDRLVFSLGDRDELYLAFQVETTGRVCRPLLEYQCFTIARIRFCSWVEVGSTCCSDGTRNCGDYVLYPGQD